MKPVAASLLALLLVAGCAAPVKPWQRELLARPEMALDGDALAAAQRKQTEFSKEGSSGDTALAGGGCGCN